VNVPLVPGRYQTVPSVSAAFAKPSKESAGCAGGVVSTFTAALSAEIVSFPRRSETR
jgi:hypothetical protein